MRKADVKGKLEAAGLARKKWGRMIIKAHERGHFLDDDSDLSGEWDTCACGMLPSKLPRWAESDWGHDEGQPIDRKLTEWGCQFHEAVCDDNPNKAADIYIKINQRAARLLAA